MVTSEFHPADLAFARAWSEHAPGIDGWRLDLGRNDGAECIAVIPPGAVQPVFFVSRRGLRTVIERRSPQDQPDTPPVPVGDYDNVRLALRALCPLDPEHLEAIHEQLEADFPRSNRKR